MRTAEVGGGGLHSHPRRFTCHSRHFWMAASLGETRAVRRDHGAIVPLSRVYRPHSPRPRGGWSLAHQTELWQPQQTRCIRFKIAQCGCRGGGTALEVHGLGLNPSASIYELGTP